MVGVVVGGWGHSKPNNNSFIKRDLGSFVEKEHNYFSQYLPSALNNEAGWDSRNRPDSSDWGKYVF